MKHKNNRSKRNHINPIISSLIIILVLFFGISYYLVSSQGIGPLALIAKTPSQNPINAKEAMYAKQDAIDKAIKVKLIREGNFDYTESATKQISAEKNKIANDLVTKSKNSGVPVTEIVNPNTKNTKAKKAYEETEYSKVITPKVLADAEEAYNQVKEAVDKKQTLSNTAITTTVDTGVSCPGANSGIGGGQYAQNGYGLRADKKTHCDSSDSGSKCPFRECVQCVNGSWDSNPNICGEGEATNYISRPDEVIDSKGAIKNNCWANGAWYSDSSNLDGSGYCLDGKWKEQKEYLAEKQKACATGTTFSLDQNTCTTPPGGNAGSETDAEKAARLQREADAAKLAETNKFLANKNYKTNTECKTAAGTTGKCIAIQGGGYGIVPVNSNITAISYNSGAAAGRPTSFTGQVSNNTYKSLLECQTALRAGEKCGTVTGTNEYRIVVDKPFVTYTFGSASATGGKIEGGQTTNSKSDCKYGGSAISLGNYRCFYSTGTTAPGDADRLGTAQGDEIVNKYQDCQWGGNETSVGKWKCFYSTGTVFPGPADKRGTSQGGVVVDKKLDCQYGGTEVSAGKWKCFYSTGTVFSEPIDVNPTTPTPLTTEQKQSIANKVLVGGGGCALGVGLAFIPFIGIPAGIFTCGASLLLSLNTP